MQTQSLGLLVIMLGLAVVLLGLIIWSGGLSWFGHLPGDLRIQRDSVRVYLPLASMLVVSMVLSALLYVIRRLL